ncbi:MAG: recombination mediator RecR [Phycisphaerales bacterium]
MGRSGPKPVHRSEGLGYPAPVERLIDELSQLPGIGRRSAERMAFHVLKGTPEDAERLARAIRDAKGKVWHCRTCFNLSEAQECAVCVDPRRDRSIVLVVEQPRDLLAIERAAIFRGVYHVLLGRLSPLEGVGPDDLTAAALLSRLGEGVIREVILGLNPTLEGDGTALYLAEKVTALGVRVTRLARGLPTGGQLEHANLAVLTDAIEGRRTME